MAKSDHYIVRTGSLAGKQGVRVRHPLSANSEIVVHPVSETVGMKRAQLWLVRIPAGKQSFPIHAHQVQEEFVFILSGTGIAVLGDDEAPVGPGDYIGYPTDGLAHTLRNTGNEDLVYLMGGERTDFEMADFPDQGKRMFATRDGVWLVDRDAAAHFTRQEWIANSIVKSDDGK